MLTYLQYPETGQQNMQWNFPRQKIFSSQINRLQLKDAGTWECEMEEYKWEEKTNCGWNFFHPELRWGDWSSGPKHKHLFEAISVRNRFTPPVPKEEDVEEEEEEEGDNDIAPVHDEGEEDEDDEEEYENSEEGSQEPGTEDHEHEEHNSEEEGVDDEEEEDEVEEEMEDLFPTSFNETDLSSNNSPDDDIIDVVRKKYWPFDNWCLVHMLYKNIKISIFILINVAQ